TCKTGIEGSNPSVSAKTPFPPPSWGWEVPKKSLQVNRLQLFGVALQSFTRGCSCCAMALPMRRWQSDDYQRTSINGDCHGKTRKTSDTYSRNTEAACCCWHQGRARR